MIRKIFALLALVGLAAAPNDAQAGLFDDNVFCEVYAVPRGSTGELVGGYVYVAQNKDDPKWDRTSDSSKKYIAVSSHDFYLYANPAPGYYFVGWYTDESCTTYFADTRYECKATVKKKETGNYYALFKPHTLVLAYAVSGHTIT